MGRPLYTPSPRQSPSSNGNGSSSRTRPSSGVILDRLLVDVAPQSSGNNNNLNINNLLNNNSRTNGVNLGVSNTSSGTPSRIAARANSRVGSSRPSPRLRYLTTLRRRRRNPPDGSSSDIHGTTRRHLRTAALESSIDNAGRRRTGVTVGVGVGVSGSGVTPGANPTSGNAGRVGVRIGTATGSRPSTGTPAQPTSGNVNVSVQPPSANVIVERENETDLEAPTNASSLNEMNFSFLIVENRRWREWLLRERRRAQCVVARTAVQGRNGTQAALRRQTAYARFCSQYFDVLLRQNDTLYIHLHRFRTRTRTSGARSAENASGTGNVQTNGSGNVNGGNTNPTGGSEGDAAQERDDGDDAGNSIRSVAEAAVAAATLMQRAAAELERSTDAEREGQAEAEGRQQTSTQEREGYSGPGQRQGQRQGQTQRHGHGEDMRPIEATFLVAQLSSRAVMGEARNVLTQDDSRVDEDVEVDADAVVGSSDMELDADRDVSGEQNAQAMGRNERMARIQAARLERLQSAFSRIHSLQRQSNTLMDVIQATAARSRVTAAEFSTASSTYLRLAQRYQDQLQSMQRQRAQQHEEEERANRSRLQEMERDEGEGEHENGERQENEGEEREASRIESQDEILERLESQQQQIWAEFRAHALGEDHEQAQLINFEMNGPVQEQVEYASNLLRRVQQDNLLRRVRQEDPSPSSPCPEAERRAL